MNGKKIDEHIDELYEILRKDVYRNYRRNKAFQRDDKPRIESGDARERRI